MNRLLRWKRKIWTNSASSSTNLSKFTLKKSSGENIVRVSSKYRKSASFQHGLVFERKIYLQEPNKSKRDFQNISLPIGSVLVLLSTKFQGRKVILLNVTKTGLFVISGPYALNGISLRRVNPRYIIPTQVEVNIKKINTSVFNDDYFNTLKQSKKNKDECFKNKVRMAHNLRQTYIDRCLIKEINKSLFLCAYLKTKYIWPY
nr:60S ribosomal protein L6B [Cryptomonas sp.]